MNNEFEARLINLCSTSVEELAREARSERYRFIDRLCDDWRSRANRFDKVGEVLLGVFDSDRLIAVGGLNCDPFTAFRIGRLRHVYVLPEFRNEGIGRSLVSTLLAKGDQAYSRIRLRTSDERAALFYQALGFVKTDEANATHTTRPARK